jgi:hypothetical protein
MLNTLLAKRIMGIARNRSVPKLAGLTTGKWYKRNKKRFERAEYPNGKVFLFLDEFTEFYDDKVGQDTLEVLSRLGYEVVVTEHYESGRSFISKGLLEEAQKIADLNVKFFREKVNNDSPLVGIEPSALLTFRDEYLRLSSDRESARRISDHTYTIEEFLDREIKRGRIRREQFNEVHKKIKVHGHCQQKALSNMASTFNVLNFPRNFEVTIMNTGCCGMAGSFGYEREHYQLSMQVGEDTLFPKIRSCDMQTEIVAAGTSCRHQIKDGTNRTAKHPISLLREALK